MLVHKGRIIFAFLASTIIKEKIENKEIKYPLQIYRSNGCLTIYKSDFSRDLLWIKDFKCSLLLFLLSFTRLNS